MRALAASLLFLLLLLAGCAETQRQVRSDYDRTANFNAYRTFDFYTDAGRSPTGGDYSTLIAQRIEAAIEPLVPVEAKSFARCPQNLVVGQATVYGRTIHLRQRNRGFYLITDEVLGALPELGAVGTGLLHLWLQHTSASLSINENADPLVLGDLEAFLRRLVPDDTPYFKHTYEGLDDMTAHVKSSLLGVQLSIPIRGGALAMGTWQGIYLGEHREHGGSRRIVASLQGCD